MILSAEFEDYMNLSNQKLIPRCMRGDQKAWYEMVRRYCGVILSVPLKKWGFSLEDAEDVSQEVFTRIYLNLGSLRDIGKLDSWILGIVHNTCVSLKRRGNTLKRPNIVLIEDMSSLKVPSGIRSPLDEILLKESGDLIRDTMEQIPFSRGQKLLRYRYMYGMDYDEISRVMGIPKGSIGPLLGRTLSYLRKTLRRRYRDYFEDRID